MLQVGWHFQEDSYDRGPIGAATFLDVGGVRAAENAAVRCYRPYFTGRADPGWLAGMLAEPPIAVQAVQAANEPNLEGGWDGPADFAGWLGEVLDRVPEGTPVYYTPMSPGIEGWQDWYTDPAVRQVIDRCAGLSIHTYGDLAGLEEIVTWIRGQFPSSKLWISEFNFGAGRAIGDLNAWADANLPPFLEWLSEDPLIEAACWFSWYWDQSPTLPSSVDGRGTRVEEVLHAWTPFDPDPVEDDVQPLRDQVWGHADALQALAGDWGDSGWPSTASGIASTAEALKTIIRGTQGEK